LILVCVIVIGVGVPDEEKAKIFSPLFTKKAKGTGLGLSVCKRIAELHNGEISFKSKFGAGPTFTLKISTHNEECGFEADQPHDILSGFRSTEQILN